MRKHLVQNGLSVQAIAGTYVVLLGWDPSEETLKKGLLGFAILRTDATENETYWLRGMKTFPGTTPSLPPGGSASTHEQPIQSFQWADYSAKPDHEYSYKITAMYGKPGALHDGASVTVEVHTEKEWADPTESPHSVFFNRAAIASQEYARRFQNQQPDAVGAAAFEWLSRGLLEALLAFISRATGKGTGLRVAIYEFQLPEILDALRDADARGADVKVVFDAIDNSKEDPVRENEEQIAAAKIGRFCEGFTNGRIMHNKFIVLLEAGAPVAVWTGSTNFTESAVYGQLNCGHAVADPDVARLYLEFWSELARDPPLAEVRGWNESETAEPAKPPANGITTVFSPRHGLSVLDRYGEIAASAQQALFMTFAFGMNKVFLPTYQKVDDVLRFALMDTEGTGKTAAKSKQDINSLRKQYNAVIAVGRNIVLNAFDRWLKELHGLEASKHVLWVHTKFMLLDPLSSDPVVITGSANFSDDSTTANHENMLVIRGDTRVADIYLGEFMRQFTDYAFRDAAYRATQHSGGAPKMWEPQDLVADDSWVGGYFAAKSSRSLRRRYFGGLAQIDAAGSIQRGGLPPQSKSLPRMKSPTALRQRK